MKRLTLCVIGTVLLIMSTTFAAEDTTKSTEIDTSETTIAEQVDSALADQIVVYYLHGNRRCMTCKKLESYSEEAITSGFERELEDSTVIWRTVNFEEEGNEHFAKNYELYTQSLVLSRVRGDKEIQWKNLDRIWKLVGDEKEFTVYVQTETREFLKPAED